MSIAGVSLELLLIQILNGLTLGILYVLIASGLSVIFGVTDILNFAHGVFYTIGAYFAFTLIGVTGSFWLALFLAPVAVAVLGAVIERTTLHTIYDRDPLYHILLTFGLVLMLSDAIEFIWGKGQKPFSIPGALVGFVDLGVINYPTYRIFLICVGAIVAFGVWLILKYSKFGLIIRGGAQNQQTVRIMGVNMSRYFTLVFAFGTLLAGIAGVLAAPYLNVSPTMGDEILIVAFIVVVVGGLGSFTGSVIAGLLIGLIQTLGSVFIPELSGFLIYLLMIGILLFRPQGLFGQYEVRSQTAKISFDKTIPPVSLTNPKVMATVIVFLLLPLVPNVVSSYYLGLLSLFFIWGLLALSLDMVMGYIGLLSFGHAAFYGLGAYTVGLVAIHFYNSFLLAAVLAILITATVAWVIGALSIRLSGVYFAMLTLAFAQMIYQLALSTFANITGGSNGLSGIPTIQLLGLSLGDPMIFYYLCLVLLVGTYYLAVRVVDSPFGRVLTAVRESERRASFLGYDTNKYKRRAFMMSGAVGGLSGSLFAAYQTFVSPNALHWPVSGDALFAMIFGGMGTLYGPIIGGGVFVGLNQILSTYFEQWRFILGFLLVLVVIFAPRGLVSMYMQVRDWLRRRRSRPANGNDADERAPKSSGDDV